MSTPTDTSGIKILHEWTVTIDRDVSETTSEIVNGQTVQVTRPVKKPVATKMALKALSRSEARAAELFLASQTAHYVKAHGLLLSSELTNRLINTTGGVFTDKEKSRIEQLRARHVELDMDLARGVNSLTAEDKDRIQKELASVRAELINLNAIQEAEYAKTAEAFAQKDLSNWLTYLLVMVDRGGKWVPFFEGQGETTKETFEKREAAMWAMEEAKDPFYLAAAGKIAAFVFWLNRGIDTPEGFKLIEDEMNKQAEARKKAEADAEAAKKQAEQAAVATEQPAPAGPTPTEAGPVPSP